MGNNKKKLLRLFILKGIFSILDTLSNIRFLHSFMLNSKFYIGAAILSVTAMETACVRETKPKEKVNEVGEKGIDTASTKKFANVDSTGNIIQIKDTIQKKKPKIPEIEPTCYVTVVTCYEVAAPIDTVDHPIKEKVFERVEKIPQFPGGYDSLLFYINQNLQLPQDASEIEGRVIVRFVVTETGEIGNIEILRSLYPSCDREVIRVIKSLPRWIPGTQDGKNVSVWQTLPVSFKVRQ